MEVINIMRLGSKVREFIRYWHDEKNIQPVYINKLQSNLLAEKNALIVGGTGGIGAAIAEAFLEAGARVVITGSNSTSLNNTLGTIDNCNCKGIVLDVKKIDSFDCKILEASSMLGDNEPISIFVNAAGYHGSDRFGEVTECTYDSVLDINLKGAFFMTQSAGNYMKIRGIKGHILNVSSAASIKPAWSPYEISKWGLRGLTLGAADELIPYGIVVNAIGPGPVATAMLGHKKGDTLYTDCVPVERFATPVEIAQLAVIMSSDLCNLVIGDTFFITGGSGTIRYR